MNEEQEITLLYQLIEKHYGSGVLMQFEDLTETDNDQLLNRIETMTTYNTYQEAKIANPESDIYVTRISNGGRDDVFGLHDDIEKFTSNCHEANPNSYCMTVEKFLADGHKFVEGDLIYSDILSKVVSVTLNGNLSVSYSIYGANTKTDSDNKRLVLRAAALETKEPKRTKVEYVKVEYSYAWEIIKLYEDGVELFKTDSDELQIERINAIALRAQSGYSFYRRIETPIEWWEDAAEFVKPIGHSEIVNGQLLVEAVMTRDQWCDFARILLEQGE